MKCKCGRQWKWVDDAGIHGMGTDVDDKGRFCKEIKKEDYVKYICPECDDFLGECGDDPDWDSNRGCYK